MNNDPLVQFKVSGHPSYTEAVWNYAQRVADARAPKTYDNGIAYGILVGVCSTLGIAMPVKGDPSNPVWEDVEKARKVIWQRFVPRS